MYDIVEGGGKSFRHVSSFSF